MVSLRILFFPLFLTSVKRPFCAKITGYQYNLGFRNKLGFEEYYMGIIGRRDGVARYDHVLNCVCVHVGGAFVRILIRNQIRLHDTVDTSQLPTVVRGICYALTFHTRFQ